MWNQVTSLLPMLSIVNVIISTCSSEQVPLQESRNKNLRDNTYSITEGIINLGIELGNFFMEAEHDRNQHIPDKTPQSSNIYDFVIIGAGTAGATLAARLSEIPEVEVLLIEAGSTENLLMDIPLAAYWLQWSDNINWMYQTKPSDKYCRGSEGNSCKWPRGKVMGGSSVLNYMVATRGAAEDYDRWAEMGNEGWAYKDVLKYFKKLETVDIPEFQSDTTYRRTGGPLNISFPVFHTPSAEAFLNAGKELGYPLVDYNGKDMIGFSLIQTTMKAGMRLSSNRAYLHPARNRKNLHVTRESMVRRVLFNRQENRAVGVEFVKHGQPISVFASKEVILSAGAIGSPQLLMLSGIGPANHLAEFGINVIKDAPVGENLMDHIFVELSHSVKNKNLVSATLLELLSPDNSYIKEFVTKRKGPLTIPAGLEAIAFLNVDNPEKRSGMPNVEILFSGTSVKGDITTPVVLGISRQVRQIWDKHIGIYGWTINPILLKPKSRGRIRLLANDVNVKPEIIPNYFDDPEDVRVMIAGIRTAIKISQTKAMQKMESRFLNDTLPGCEDFEYDSDAYWNCTMRTTGLTTYHYSGTCKMAPRGDPTAVVDPKLKVIGVKGLRVIDTSIMPEVIAGHTNLPTYMIAEKAADMIKEEWGYLDKYKNLI